MINAIERTLHSSDSAIDLDPPNTDEYDPYYARYIDRVPRRNFLATLRRQCDEVESLFGGVSEAQANSAYADGKWTLKEVLGHLIDTERVFAFRAASIARNDPSALPNFDQDAWVVPAHFNRRSMDHLLAEWMVIRAATLLLIEGLPPDAPTRRGIASDKEVSVRALLYVTAGHVDYHLKIVRERYLGGSRV